MRNTLLLPKYNLPDAKLIEDNSFVYKYAVWVPAETAVIIGRSNKPENSAFLENTEEDNTPVYQRPSGGEAVVISPKTLVISVAYNAPEQKQSTFYFKEYNERIIRALESLGIKELKFEGISDITLNGRKILGCSIYRNKNKVFYHAVLNLSEDTGLLMRYLKFPGRTPEYRANRNHDDFVTSIKKEGFDIKTEAIKKAIAGEMLLPPH